jgi:hypothetical protein
MFKRWRIRRIERELDRLDFEHVELRLKLLGDTCTRAEVQKYVDTSKKIGSLEQKLRRLRRKL